MRGFLNWFGVPLAGLAIVIVAASIAPSQRIPSVAPGFRTGVFHYSSQPHWGCFGYCDGPLTPHQPHWGCFGYCPGPLPYPHHYTCFGYCPYVPPYYPVYPPYPPLVYPPAINVPSVASYTVDTPPTVDTPSPAKSEKPQPKDGDAVYAGKTLSEWVQALKDPDPRNRANAAHLVL